LAGENGETGGGGGGEETEMEEDDEDDDDGEEEEEELEVAELDSAPVEEAWSRAWAEAAARIRAVAKEALDDEEEAAAAAKKKQEEEEQPAKRKSKRKSSAGGASASAPASASVPPPPPPPPLSEGEAERLASLVTRCSAVLSAMQGAAEAVAAASSSSSSSSLTRRSKTSSTIPSVATAVAALDRAVHALCGDKNDDSSNGEVYGRCAELLAQARALIRPAKT
jgi:hypothetical protein